MGRYRNSLIVLEYFRHHRGATAASYTISEWAEQRWPGFTRVMAYGALHHLEKTRRVIRVGETCDFRLPSGVSRG